jgi:CRISPR-associated protein Cas5t
MLGVYVTVPVACFRKGLAREYLETEPLPPPATCYGFLLSLVGETDRRRHVGARVAPVLLNDPPTSVVLRTVWRVKRTPLGSPGNTRPDYQQLLTGVELLVWLDSIGESAADRLEDRVRTALADPGRVSRFGGLSLGESTHLVDDVSLWDRVAGRFPGRAGRAFLLADRGRLTLPVWVDHVGSAGTRYATGDLVEVSPAAPDPGRMPVIAPPGWVPVEHPTPVGN